MAFEIVKPEFIPVENGSQDHSKGNELSQPITFGSHGPNEVADGPKAQLPKDAVDEWPTAHQVHSFYLVRYRTYDDPKIKAKLEAAEKDFRSKADARSQIIEKKQAIRAKRFKISEQITPLSEENQRFRDLLDGKKKEMEPLNEVLGQLRSNNSRDRGAAVFSSEAELNKQIKNLQNRIQHESIPLTEEKQILREIKQLEATRPQVIAIAQRRAEIEESSETKADIKDQYKLMGDDVNGVKKEKKLITAKLSQLLEERKAIDKEIEKLDAEIEAATEKRDKARDVVNDLRKKRDEGNECFYSNRNLLNKAKNLANMRDVSAVKDISNSELEKFMKMWNESKAFRDDYEKRILVSLDNRQLSRDGRMRNPDEKPLVVPEPSVSSKPEQVLPLKPKQGKKETVPENGVVAVEKSQKENIKAVKEVKSKEVEQPVKLDNKEETVEAEKPKIVEKKVDEKKLKEMKREEEKAKAKQAAERKGKLAEKAAAKAAIKAQKEAEKKEKEREKKLKKKGLLPEPEEQPTEAEAEVAEPEKPEEATEEPAVQKSKPKTRKAGGMKNVNKIKGPDASISKVILKRKKASTNYWVWAAPAAVSVMMVFVIGYKYLM